MEARAQRLRCGGRERVISLRRVLGFRTQLRNRALGLYRFTLFANPERVSRGSSSAEKNERTVPESHPGMLSGALSQKGKQQPTDTPPCVSFVAVDLFLLARYRDDGALSAFLPRHIQGVRCDGVSSPQHPECRKNVGPLSFYVSRHVACQRS